AFQIVANAVYLGVQSDARLKNELTRVTAGDAPKQVAWYFGNLVFSALFLAELLLRMCADGPSGFFGPGADQLWNWFDALIVATGALGAGAEAADLTLGPVLVMLSSLRLLQLMRLGRCAGDSALLQALRTLSYSISRGFASIAAAFLGLAVWIYIFTLVLMQGVIGYVSQAEQAQS
ncbi:unnamed protein product, partial [Polarella glacialis]